MNFNFSCIILKTIDGEPYDSIDLVFPYDPEFNTTEDIEKDLNQFFKHMFDGLALRPLIAEILPHVEANYNNIEEEEV